MNFRGTKNAMIFDQMRKLVLNIEVRRKKAEEK
jgi:hypothetical protein